MFVWTVIKEALYDYNYDMNENTEQYNHKKRTIKQCLRINKNLPINAIHLIREYSKPITRGDWRNGSQTNHIFKYSPIMVETHRVLKNRIKQCNEYDNLADVIVNIGSQRVFQMYPYIMDYNNFYFYLVSEDNAFFIKKPVLKITGKFKYIRKITQDQFGHYEFGIYDVEFLKN